MGDVRPTADRVKTTPSGGVLDFTRGHKEDSSREVPLLKTSIPPKNGTRQQVSMDISMSQTKHEETVKEILPKSKQLKQPKLKDWALQQITDNHPATTETAKEEKILSPSSLFTQSYIFKPQNEDNEATNESLAHIKKVITSNTFKEYKRSNSQQTLTRKPDHEENISEERKSKSTKKRHPTSEFKWPTITEQGPSDQNPLVAKVTSEDRKQVHSRPLRGLVWNTCRGGKCSWQKRLDVLKRYEKDIDFAFLIDTDIQSRTNNVNHPDKETKRKLTIPGWHYQLKKLDKNYHILLTKDSANISAAPHELGIEWSVGEHWFLGTYFPFPQESKYRERLQAITTLLDQQDKKVYVIADWNTKTFGNFFGQLIKASKTSQILDSEQRQGVVCNFSKHGIAKTQRKEEDKEGKRISDHDSVCFTFNDINIDVRRTVKFVAKQEMVRRSTQLALAFAESNELKDFSALPIPTIIKKTGFKDYRSTLSKIIINKIGTSDQNKLAYKIFKTLFGKDQNHFEGELPTGVIEAYQDLINPNKLSFKKQEWIEIQKEINEINAEKVINENLSWRVPKNSHSSALDAFGLCFEEIRQTFDNDKTGRIKALNFAKALIYNFNYNVISTFALKKKPDATRFEDLRIISIMPTPWRMIEDTLIDALAEKIKDAVNKSETYQYGFFKGHTISQAIERAKKRWSQEDQATILLDVRKAYDTVSLEKLSNLRMDGETGKLFELLKRAYSDHFRVQMGNRLLLKGIGLPQGASLSPILFNFLLHCAITKDDTDFSLLPYLTAFADDIIISAPSETLKPIFTELKNRLLELGLKLNLTKSELIDNPAADKTDITEITKSTRFKYLGIKFEVQGNQITDKENEQWSLGYIANLQLTVRHKLIFIKSYIVGRQMFNILYQSGHGGIDAKLTKLRRAVCAIFKIPTVSYLDLAMFGLDPFEINVKAAITDITQRRRINDPIKSELISQVKSILESWKTATKRLEDLLSDFTFDFNAIKAEEKVIFNNYSEERERWIRVLAKPLLIKYRRELAEHSRDQKAVKIRQVEDKPIRYIAQLCYWETKANDIIEQAQSLAGRTAAKCNVKTVLQILTLSAKIFEEKRQFEWIELATFRKIEEAESEILASKVNRGLKSSESENWERVLSIIDLWSSSKTWYTTWPLGELEKLLEEADEIKLRESETDKMAGGP